MLTINIQTLATHRKASRLFNTFNKVKYKAHPASQFGFVNKNHIEVVFVLVKLRIDYNIGLPTKK